MISGITLGSVYVFCFVLGLGFAILSAIFSAFSGGHSGLHVHADHTDVGHVFADIADSEHLTHNSPGLSMTISVFATSLGGFGICWQKFFGEKYPEAGIVSGVIFGVVIAAVTFYAFALVFKETQGSSTVHAGDLVGAECTLAVGITDENPIGQAVYTARGRRQVSMARSIDGNPIEKNRKVIIIKVEKGCVYVKE